jgi:hypothetical protein
MNINRHMQEWKSEQEAKKRLIRQLKWIAWIVIILIVAHTMFEVSMLAITL